MRERGVARVLLLPTRQELPSTKPAINMYTEACDYIQSMNERNAKKSMAILKNFGRFVPLHGWYGSLWTSQPLVGATTWQQRRKPQQASAKWVTRNRCNSLIRVARTFNGILCQWGTLRRLVRRKGFLHNSKGDCVELCFAFRLQSSVLYTRSLKISRNFLLDFSETGTIITARVLLH
jgi:hypothetical protein